MCVTRRGGGEGGDRARIRLNGTTNTSLIVLNKYNPLQSYLECAKYSMYSHVLATYKVAFGTILFCCACCLKRLRSMFSCKSNWQITACIAIR